MNSSSDSSPIELKCKGLLFDMDGILISSIASVERCWTKWSQLRGIHPESALKIVHGCRAIDTMRKLHPDLDLEKESKILEDFEVADQEGVHALPGVCELLAALPEDRWTVVTSATDRLARARLSAAGIVPPVKMVTGDDVAEGKPNPAPYLAGARKLGFRPEECVVFEDALSGVESGRVAGCTVVATTFTHQASELTGADFLLENLSGVRVEAGPGGIRLRF
jgi:mannitol-1-/sugar-/sorbitol-6-phosphatase